MLLKQYLRVLIAALCVGVLPLFFSQAQDNSPRKQQARSASSAGRTAFNSNCAGCHGLDGRGSEKAPSIATTGKVMRFSDRQIADIISNGVPGTGMPAFPRLTEREVHAIVSHLRLLQGQRQARTFPGDPAKGKAIFLGKGGCSSCHMISGEGGFIGPDLTAYGSQFSAKEIEDAIVQPQRIDVPGYRAAVVTTRAGERVEGIIRNEDNFSIQLQSMDGSFHFFQRSDLQNVEYINSLMPTDYGRRLSSEELKDLVSFLMSTTPPEGTPQNQKKRDFNE